MDQSIEDILNGPDYFLCDRFKTRMKKVRCVEKQAGPQAGFEIDYADTMCRDCAQGIEIKGEVQGLDIKQIRRERREFKYKNKKARSSRLKAERKMDSRFHGNDEDEHIERPAVITEGKEGEEMAKCLVKDCEREGKHRGLCSAHIQRYRKGTLPGVEPLPSNRGKSPKKDRIQAIKESAERVSKKAEGFRLKAVGEDKQIRRQKPEVSSQKVEVIPAVTEEVTTDMVFSLSSNVEDMEKQNRADVKVFARAFMAGLKGELIAAMTEQMASSVEAEAV